MKTGFNEVQRNIQETRLPILKTSQDHPQKNFFNFLTSQKYFHNLIIFWGKTGNIFETEIGVIVLKICQRSIFVIIKSYTFNAKLTFPLKTFFKNIFL